MPDDPTVCEHCWNPPPCLCASLQWTPRARGGPGDFKEVISPGVRAIISKPLAYGSHGAPGAPANLTNHAKELIVAAERIGALEAERDALRLLLEKAKDDARGLRAELDEERRGGLTWKEATE